MGEAKARAARGDVVESIYQLRITLLGTDPRVWRRIRVDSDITLAELHEIIQAVMPWYGGHLHVFETEDASYAPPGHDVVEPLFGPPDGDERTMRLRRVAPGKGARLLYEYDFGDSWEHEILVEDRLAPEPGRRYPVCIAGERAAPPEDSGGVWGFYDLLDARDDPDHPDHEEAVDWLDEDFDPDAFDVAETNRRLERRRRRAGAATADDLPDPELAAMGDDIPDDEFRAIVADMSDDEIAFAMNLAADVFADVLHENPDADPEEIEAELQARLDDYEAGEEGAEAWPWPVEHVEVPPEQAKRLDAALTALERNAADDPEVNDETLERAARLLFDFAIVVPDGFGRAAPEGWAGGALHAAHMRLWFADRLTAEEVADRFGVSKATVYARSRELRDAVPPEPAPDLDRLLRTLENAIAEMGEVDDLDELGAFGGFGQPLPTAGGMVDPGEVAQRLEPVTRGLDLQVDIDGEFDYERFRRANGVPDRDVDALREAFAHGLEAYHLDIYGYPKYGEGLFWLVDQRLGDPGVFGYAALAALRDPGLSPETKDVVARYVAGLLAVVAADLEHPVPDGAVAALGRLIERGLIDDDALLAALAVALSDEGGAADVRLEELRPAIRAAGRAGSMPEPARAALLARLVTDATRTTNADPGRALIAAFADEDEIPAPVRTGALETVLDSGRGGGVPMFLQPSVRVEAGRRLAAFTDEPARFGLELLDRAEETNGDVYYQAAAEILMEHGDALPADRLREAVERGVSSSRAQARLPFYRLGASRIDPGYRERAAEDRAATVRRWAAGDDAEDGDGGGPGSGGGRRADGRGGQTSLF